MTASAGDASTGVFGTSQASGQNVPTVPGNVIDITSWTRFGPFPRSKYGDPWVTQYPISEVGPEVKYASLDYHPEWLFTDPQGKILPSNWIPG